MPSLASFPNKYAEQSVFSFPRLDDEKLARKLLSKNK